MEISRLDPLVLSSGYIAELSLRGSARLFGRMSHGLSSEKGKRHNLRFSEIKRRGGLPPAKPLVDDEAFKHGYSALFVVY
jgi:hypothetical protein